MSDRQSELSPDEFVAERVLQQLEVFPKRFRELGEGGELRKLLRSPHTLYGARIGQAPEDFTEQYLIEPVLHALGYLNPIHDDYAGAGPHFVRRPTTFRNIEAKRPDYKLENVSAETVCILEAKAAGGEQLSGSKQEATDDVRNYVTTNTFAEYLESRECRFLVAIGTDGLRWTMWAKDVRDRETNEEMTTVDLSPAVKSIAQEHSVIEGTPKLQPPAVRTLLTEEFVPAFSARRINEFVEDSFS